MFKILISTSHSTLNGFSYRLRPDQSFFEVLPPREEVVEEGESCTCPSDKHDHHFKDCKDNANRFKGFGPESGEDIAERLRKGGRVRRSAGDESYTDDIMDYEDRSFFQDDEELQYALTRMRRKRSAQGMSREDAKRHCEVIIEDSIAGKICKTVPGFNLTIAMQQCITDLKVRKIPQH